MQGNSKLLSLPDELLLRIFGFVYQPWSLEIELRENEQQELYHEKAVVRATPPPSAALLATCKSIYGIAEGITMDSFTGVLGSRDAPHLRTLGHVLQQPRWIRIKPHVKKLNLPQTTYSLITSKAFIMLFPALEEVELFETVGFRMILDEYGKSSNEEIFQISNEYLQTRSTLYVPAMPEEVPFSCNGGHINLLVHFTYTTEWLHNTLPTLDVSFRVTPGPTLHVVDKVWRSASFFTNKLSLRALPPLRSDIT